MKTVELYARVRHAVLIEGISERAAADRFGINAGTVSKMLKFSVPPGYARVLHSSFGVEGPGIPPRMLLRDKLVCRTK
jgi:hypothetical protein